jgi:peptide/nickel transport system ATP-binding protein
VTDVTETSLLDMNQTGGCTVSDLRVALTGTNLDVVDEINIELRPGEVVGLVGESGSGKTTAGTALLAYSRRGAFIEHGSVTFEGQNVLALPWEKVREIRGMKIAYVPQDPGAALNPAIRIGRQIVELLELHGIGSGRGAH